MHKTILAAAVLLAACGDPETNDRRGYTKAPLEEPTVLVRGEQVSDMTKFGGPLYPEAPLIKPEAEEKQAADQGQTPQAGPAPAGATAADVTSGGQIFAGPGNCFTCHGANGTGGPLAPALNDGQWLHIDGSFGSLQQIINAGVPQPKQYPAAMPAKGGAPLTDEQVRQVAAYVYSISR